MFALGLVLGAMAAAPAFAAGAQARATHKTPTASQQKMATCSHESKGMKGDAHKKFMSNCLHRKTMATAPMHTRTTQQQKMTTCNADAKAKSLKGAARKTFMSSCLKG
jgi:hypothetical protein